MCDYLPVKAVSISEMTLIMMQKKTLLAFFAKRVLASEYTTVLHRAVLTYKYIDLARAKSEAPVNKCII